MRTAALLLVSLFLASPAAGASSAAEVARLEADLTPLGAERGGNPEGTIPPWTGGITEPPPAYEPGQWHPDPFAADEQRFTITAANLEQHAVHLTPGQQALLRAYPDTWRMHVYPTRRSASFPEWVYEGVIRNAGSAELVVEGKGGVLEARIGSPFPIPSSGVEVVWNHNLRWRGVRVTRSQAFAAVTRAGNYRVVLQIQDLGIPYASPKETAFTRKYPNLMLGIKTKTISPQLLAGEGALVLEPIDQTDDARRSWSYLPGLRRVIRVPFFSYDFPAPNSDNLRSVDEAFLFNGPPDRFDWRLVGKREIYVPYNSYRLHSDELGAGDVLRVGHIEPQHARYELHRVWVVEGTLRSGKNHIYSRRTFYVDEDSWRITLSEGYDHKDRLWRVAESHAVNYYEVPVFESTLDVHHDLQARRYLAVGLDNGRTPPRFANDGDPREFSPNALLYYVR